MLRLFRKKKKMGLSLHKIFKKIDVNKYGLHEVVYGSYETAEEALKALRDIRKTHNEDAWLLVKELDLVVE